MTNCVCKNNKPSLLPLSVILLLFYICAVIASLSSGSGLELSPKTCRQMCSKQNEERKQKQKVDWETTEGQTDKEMTGGGNENTKEEKERERDKPKTWPQM